jgi:ankyrin repeat protein
MEALLSLMERNSFDDFVSQVRHGGCVGPAEHNESVLGFLTRMVSSDEGRCLRFFEFLLRSGADPNVPDDLGRTPLSNLARSNRVDCIELFIRYGADINLRPQNGFTALQEALRVNDALEAAKYLLERSDLRLDKQYKRELLDCARRAGARKSLSLLRDYGIIY